MPSPDDIARRFPRLLEHAHKDAASALAPLLVERRLEPGEHALRPDTPSRALLLVWMGQLGVSTTVDGRRQALGSVGTGCWVGDVTFIDGGAPTAEVVALEPTTLLVLEFDRFARLFDTEPHIARSVLHCICTDLSERLRATDRLLASMRGDGPLDGVRAPTPDQVGWLRGAWLKLWGTGDEA